MPRLFSFEMRILSKSCIDGAFSGSGEFLMMRYTSTCGKYRLRAA
jgi:hypothetical protein